MMDFEKIRDAVNSIEMSKTMKNRVKNGNILEKKKSAQVHYRRWISVACAFGILLSIMISIPFFNKNGELSVPFAITAYALSDDGNQLKVNLSSEKATFELSTEDRIDGGLNSVSGEGANLIFTDVMLNITGEHINTITYTINKGNFIEDVTLTDKERRDNDWLLQEKIYIIHGNPVSDTYQGIKEIGNTYTAKYNEQDKYKYTLAIPHDGNGVVVDDIIIDATVKYTNGTSEQQDIVVTQESNSISLKLN